MSSDYEVESDYISRPELESSLSEKIDSSKSVTHIYGQPGVGKTYILDWVQQEFEEEYYIERVNFGSHDGQQEVAKKVFQAVTSNLPEEAEEGEKELTGLSFGISTPLGGGSAGASWENQDPEWTQSPFNFLNALRGISDIYPEDRQLIVCIDDLHKLDANRNQLTDLFDEISDILPQEILILTSGRVKLRRDVHSIEVSVFTEQQTIGYFEQNLPETGENIAIQLHDRLGGHPYYIGLLPEIKNPEKAIEVPENQIREYIESEYLDTLSDDEERFLFYTSPLTELDKNVCSSVLEDRFEYDQVKSRRTLQDLSNRVIIQELGRAEHGKKYKLHDKFRDFLLEDFSEAEEIHSKAYQYYSRIISEYTTSGVEDLELASEQVDQLIYHLSKIKESEETIDVSEFLTEVLREDRLEFYPKTIILDLLKEWNIHSLSDLSTDTLIDCLNQNDDLARYFFDEELHLSWPEEMYERGFFDPPSHILIGYLNEIVSKHSEFVVNVINSTSTDDEQVQRRLAGVASDLPGKHAEMVVDTISEWIETSESVQFLQYQALDIVEHLISHNRTDPALKLIESVTQPRPELDEENSPQRFSVYRLVKVLEGNLEDLAEKHGLELIKVFEENLMTSLETETSEDRNPKYEKVASVYPIEELDYIEEESGTRKEILFSYLIKATEYWIRADPSSADGQALLDRYLASEHPNLRRIGFYILRQFPEHYETRLEQELTNFDSYYDRDIEHDFFRLLESGFEHIEDPAKDEIIEHIKSGPRNKEWISTRAESIAERNRESPDKIEQELLEKWRLKHLIILSGKMSDEDQSYIEQLKERHGKPDSVPTESRISGPMMGFAGSPSSEIPEEIQDSSPAELLRICAERADSEDDEDLEIDHRKLSEEVRRRISERPSEFTPHIEVLKQAPAPFAESTIQGLKGAVESDKQFEWNQVIILCDHIIENPGQWSTRCRYDIVKLLKMGFLADSNDFPSGLETSVKSLLLQAIQPVSIPDEVDQPAALKGGLGNSVEDVRAESLLALLRFIDVSQNSISDDQRLENEVRQVLEGLISEDNSGTLRNYIGRSFRLLWALDEQFVRNHIGEIFPIGENVNDREKFSVAWNGYTAAVTPIEPSIDILKPYYNHATALLGEHGSEGMLNADSTAAHIASLYIFKQEGLDDADSIVSTFYSAVSPDVSAKIPGKISRSLGEEENNLDDHWAQIRRLWEWRLDTVESEVSDVNEAEEFTDEFWNFINCFSSSEESSIVSEKEVLQRSVPFLTHDSTAIRVLEEILTKESQDYPLESIQIYRKMVTEIPPEQRYDIVRASRDDDREKILENTVNHPEALENAFDVANFFASQGSDFEKEFLDKYLGK